ncbi:MAG: TolC family protein [Hymenobacteraceae bacterium]|nr:TolC family protein [Hymenobacteraceae bacterium]MDX5397215.1 TolC family protein [Hymenobacteraceae bacterium]MDX5444320.1 TolC family protein [Hymenobacteraceae bacterium]MDX5513291.1 TolC family protein [Hymenobacteraceae bacterium]
MSKILKSFAGAALLFALAAVSANAQQPLSLEQCLQHAKDHNIQLNRARQEAAMASVNLKRSRMDYLPKVNASADVNRIYGTAFDNNTFQRVTATTTTSYPIINAQLVLFDGFQKYFSLKQNRALATAGQAMIARTETEVEARVILYFLQSIFDQENIRIAEQRIELLQAQLNKVQKLEQSGVKTEADIFLIRSQVATEKLDLLTHQNNYKRNLLLLLQEANLPTAQEYQLTPPATAENTTTTIAPLEELLQEVNQNSIYLKEARLQVEANRQALHVSRTNLSPTLTLTGSIGSSYSSNGLFDPETRRIVPTPYFDQLDQNLFQVLTLRLNIPVFNGLSAHYNNQLARLQLRNAELNYSTTEQQLRQTVQQAYHDVVTAKQKYQTVQTELEAVQKSFDYAKRKYDSGSIDFFVYLETLNNKSKAEVQLLQSQYEFYLKQQVLNLYKQ